MSKLFVFIELTVWLLLTLVLKNPTDHIPKQLVGLKCLAIMLSLAYFPVIFQPICIINIYVYTYKRWFINSLHIAHQMYILIFSILSKKRKPLSATFSMDVKIISDDHLTIKFQAFMKSVYTFKTLPENCSSLTVAYFCACRKHL